MKRCCVQLACLVGLLSCSPEAKETFHRENTRGLPKDTDDDFQTKSSVLDGYKRKIDVLESQNSELESRMKSSQTIIDNLTAQINTLNKEGAPCVELQKKQIDSLIRCHKIFCKKIEENGNCNISFWREGEIFSILDYIKYGGIETQYFSFLNEGQNYPVKCVLDNPFEFDTLAAENNITLTGKGTTISRKVFRDVNVFCNFSFENIILDFEEASDEITKITYLWHTGKSEGTKCKFSDINDPDDMKGVCWT